MDSNALIEGALTVGVGAVAGGLTNAVAVWMLFHPHEPVRVGPFLMQGAIPKNKARLARSVGKTVGERLLTAEDLTQRLSAPEIRTAFDQAVRQGVEQLLRRDFGSLRATLGHEASSAVERELPGLAGRAAARLAGHVASPEFGQTVAVLLGDLTARLGSRPSAPSSPKNAAPACMPASPRGRRRFRPARSWAAPSRRWPGGNWSGSLPTHGP
ncbi:MAG: DUF445 family protein [Gemmatimonadota bacterium]|nr:DUF445 family protein [Gemmatimonadota bacterium]